MTTARYRHGITVYNGYVYALGGYNGTSYVATTEYAPINANTPSLGTWTATTSLAAVRSYPGVVVYNGYIYAVGGMSGG